MLGSWIGREKDVLGVCGSGAWGGGGCSGALCGGGAGTDSIDLLRWRESQEQEMAGVCGSSGVRVASRDP